MNTERMIERKSECYKKCLGEFESCVEKPENEWTTKDIADLNDVVIRLGFRLQGLEGADNEKIL